MFVRERAFASMSVTSPSRETTMSGSLLCELTSATALLTNGGSPCFIGECIAATQSGVIGPWEDCRNSKDFRVLAKLGEMLARLNIASA